MAPRTGSGGSLAAVAAEIYLDTQEVKDLIALTRDEIRRHHYPRNVRDGWPGEDHYIRRNQRR